LIVRCSKASCLAQLGGSTIWRGFLLLGGLALFVVLPPAQAESSALPPKPPPTTFFPWVNPQSQGTAAPALPPTAPGTKAPRITIGPPDWDPGPPKILTASHNVPRVGGLFVVRLMVGTQSVIFDKAPIRCSAKLGGKRLRVRVRSHRHYGLARCGWRIPARGLHKRLTARMTVVAPGRTVQKVYRLRVQSRSARSSAANAHSSATGPGPYHPGQLRCFVPQFYAALKTVNAETPEVAAVNLTSGRDAGYVWWIARAWELDGANLLDGNDWHPENWNPGLLMYAYANDATFTRDWVQYSTGLHTVYIHWDFLDGQKDQAVENYVYWPSTGRSITYWSSDAYGYEVYCSGQGQIYRF
jgi:hypothetical protein